MALIYRFVGDPAGYRVDDSDWPPIQAAVKWTDAKVGMTDHVVFIDTAKAYVVARELDA